MRKTDLGNWHMKSRILKYNEDITPYRRPNFWRNPIRWFRGFFFTGGKWEELFHELFKPYEVIEQEGNCLLNTGIDEMWDLIIGDSANHFTEAGTQIGVGDDDTAANATQTDLQAAENAGTHKKYNDMESGYPTSTSQKATFKASFGTDDANFAWEEWVVKQETSEKCLNRKAESLGTKTTGTWTLEVSITLS